MSNSNNRADRHKDDTEQAQCWQMAIETHQDSGLSVRAFCKQEGLSEPSFYAWRKKLATNDEPPTKPAGKNQSLKDGCSRKDQPHKIIPVGKDNPPSHGCIRNNTRPRRPRCSFFGRP